MKTNLRFFIPAAAAMLLIPAAAAGKILERESASDLAAEFPLFEQETVLSYKVLRTETDTVEVIPLREYLIGAAAAELPAVYEPEAMKAQIVASHTYAERMHRQHAAHPDPALRGADFSDDSTKYQAFYSTEDLQQLYGLSFSKYYKKWEAAADAAGDLLLCKDGEPIVAAFHAVSGGQTENAADIWGQALPCLTAVPSPQDSSAPHFEDTTDFPADELRALLTAAHPEIVLPEDPAQWLSVLDTTASGTVLNVQAGSIRMTGQKLRELLNLRSACINITYTNNSFRFITKGFGHGVGMSQYGANEMALAGSSFTEILLHYYPGAEIVRCSG